VADSADQALRKDPVNAGGQQVRLQLHFKQSRNRGDRIVGVEC
jgi:hypothetical protein